MFIQWLKATIRRAENLLVRVDFVGEVVHSTAFAEYVRTRSYCKEFGWYDIHIADHAVLAQTGDHRPFECSGQSSKNALFLRWVINFISTRLLVLGKGEILNFLLNGPVTLAQFVNGYVAIRIKRLAVRPAHTGLTGDITYVRLIHSHHNHGFEWKTSGKIGR